LKYNQTLLDNATAKYWLPYFYKLLGGDFVRQQALRDRARAHGLHLGTIEQHLSEEEMKAVNSMKGVFGGEEAGWGN